MASPPGSAYPTLSIPKKRPSLPNPPGNPKRRKPSSAGPSHLRQTSFPPEYGNAAYSPEASTPGLRSPSVESSLAAGGTTPSVVSGIGRTKKRKKQVRASADDAASVTGVSTKGGRPTAAGSATGEQEEEEEEEEDDDEVDLEEARKNLTMEGGKMSQAAEKQAREHLAMLVDAFNPEQSDRYDVWRRVKLKRDSVRRLVNHTLSQSVPVPVVNTVSGCAKVLIGELIEKARDVQMQFQAAEQRLPTGESIADEAAIAERTNPMDRGPLTPDHLREALRRYKKENSSGGAGYLGLSLRGPENPGARTGGKRLFR